MLALALYATSMSSEGIQEMFSQWKIFSYEFLSILDLFSLWPILVTTIEWLPPMHILNKLGGFSFAVDLYSSTCLIICKF